MTFTITRGGFDGIDSKNINPDKFFKLQKGEKLVFDIDDFLQNIKKEISDIPEFVDNISNNNIYIEKIIGLKSNIQKYTSENKIDQKETSNQIKSFVEKVKSQKISLIYIIERLRILKDKQQDSMDEIIYIGGLPFKKIYILIAMIAMIGFGNIENKANDNGNINSKDANYSEKITNTTKEQIGENMNILTPKTASTKQSSNSKKTILKPNKGSKIIIGNKKININKRESGEYGGYCAKISRQIVQAMGIVPPQETRIESFNKNHALADALGNYEALCLGKNTKILQKFKDSNPGFWISTNLINTNDEDDIKKRFSLKKFANRFLLKGKVTKNDEGGNIYISSKLSEHKIYGYDDIYRELSENEAMSNNSNNAFLMRTLQNDMEITDGHQVLITKIQNILNGGYEYYAIDPLLNHNFGFKGGKSEDPNMIPIKDYINFCNKKGRYILGIMSLGGNKTYNSDQIYTIKKYNENIKNISQENMSDFENNYKSGLEKFTEILDKKGIDKDSIIEDINIHDTKAHIFTESSLKSNNNRKNGAGGYGQLEPAAYVDIQNYINGNENMSAEEKREMINDEKSDKKRFGMSGEDQMLYYFVYNNIILKKYSKAYTERIGIDFETVDENTKSYIQQGFYNRGIGDFSKILKGVKQEYEGVINGENIVSFLKQKTNIELQEMGLDFYEYKKVTEYLGYIEKIESYKMIMNNPQIAITADSVLLASN